MPCWDLFYCVNKERKTQIRRDTRKQRKENKTKKGRLKRPSKLQENDLDGWWQLRPGARLPSEAELRRMLSPDQWCLYDTTKTGMHRLWEQGISKYDALVQIPAERMQIAIEQLPEVCTLFILAYMILSQVGVLYVMLLLQSHHRFCSIRL